VAAGRLSKLHGKDDARFSVLVSDCCQGLGIGKEMLKKLIKVARAENLETLTATGTTLGTPLYIAPEQVGRKDIDGRADLYSLGVVLYEMCTGKVPFHDENPMTVMMMHMTEDPPPPSRLNPQIPGGLEKVILRLLEKDREDRFSDAGELIKALEPFG